jgi:Zn-dependent peptidase ImmA (M78 family)/DNA-binding XRE family transcriptional regulator
MPSISPNILRWARETAGLSQDDAAEALGLKTARGATGQERLMALEEGQDEPSRPLLVRMAKVYHRPLLVFYLSEPPKTGDRGQDFRTLPEKERNNPEIDALVRDIKARQTIIHSVLEDTESEPVGFIASAKVAMPLDILVKRMRAMIEFSLEEFRATKSADEAFAYLRGKIEASGVFVLLLGNLGSYHTNIPVKVFRGFAIADTLAPMIVINDQDVRSAWSFTAVHELAHLWLGQTGISGEDAADNNIEQYCNAVAGEFLLPKADLNKLGGIGEFSEIESVAAAISGVAEEWRVSSSMVAYKLFLNGFLKRTRWQELSAYFRRQWEEQRERQTEKNRAAEGGPNYYVVKRHRVGPAVMGLVRRSLEEGILSYTKAGRVLGVKPRNVEPLLAVRGAR